MSDGSDWALDQAALETAWTANYLGYRTRVSKYPTFANRGSRTHFVSPDLAVRFASVSDSFSFDYFHGLPHQGERYEERMRRLLKVRSKISNIRVTNEQVASGLQDLGFGEQVVKIPLGVDLNKFHLSQDKQASKAYFGIPQDAFVLGSFQKDGLGWDLGMDPKVEKGPDILIEAINQVSKKIENLHVLLAGPSRGFVTSCLDELKIPFTHLGQVSEQEITLLYQALDVYLIASRLEGGPRAILESLASGVPVVATPVGQTYEVMQPELGNLICSSVNPGELAALVVKVFIEGTTKAKSGFYRSKAELFSLGRQAELWRKVFD